MLDLLDLFGIGKRRKELIAPYVRPSDNALTKKAIYLALTKRNFADGNTGVQILKEKLGKDEATVKCMMLKLHKRGIASATSVCEIKGWLNDKGDEALSVDDLMSILEGGDARKREQREEEELLRILRAGRRGPGAGWGGYTAYHKDDDDDNGNGDEIEESEDPEP